MSDEPRKDDRPIGRTLPGEGRGAGRPVGSKTRPIDIRLAERKAREGKVDPHAGWRDTHGHLLPGGPANPEACRRGGEARMKNLEMDKRWLDAIKNTVAVEDIEAIVLKAMEQAKRGNRFARDFLFDRAIGKPRQVVQAAGQDSPLLQLFNLWMAQAAAAKAPVPDTAKLEQLEDAEAKLWRDAGKSDAEDNGNGDKRAEEGEEVR